MTGDSHLDRAVEAVLPEDLEITPQPQPVEAPPPDVRPAEAAEDRGALAFLKVFRHRNYRLFFTGQLVSLMGTWITNVTQGWLVYSLTHSPLLLGITSFAGSVPVFFFSAFGGAIADRFDHRRSLFITQALACLQSAALAVLTLTGLIQVWQIVALALFQGFINAFDVPIRQAMTVEMVGREDLRHAISLNSMMFNLARVIGPSIGGILIAICSAFGAAYLSLLPAFARDVLRQGSEGLGFLYTGVGAGAFLGAYALARVPDRRLFVTPVMAALGFGISLILFSQSRWFGLSLVLLIPAAFSLMLLGGSTNSIVQLLARDDMRGRVVAIYAMGFLGMMPWGSLILGWAAEHLGTGRAVALGGCICILAAGLAWRDRRGGNWRLRTVE
jgi:MFS family permease